MSYVIQNFYNMDKKLVLNYRLKYLLFLFNWELILFLFKINLSYASYIINLPDYFRYALAFKSIKFSNWVKFFYKNSLYLPGNYSNNFYLSILYRKFFNLLIYTHTSKTSIRFELKVHSVFFYNIYWRPVKIVHFELNKNYYDKIMIFYFYFNHFFWYNFDKNFNITFSFLSVHPLFLLNAFYNNFFFPIYNC